MAKKKSGGAIPPFKNARLSASARVKDLLSRMTLEEKAAQMMCVWQEKATKLVDAAKHGTSLPQPIGLGATFNPELVERLYTMTAKEVRARGAHHALTPVVDVARDPRWGRVEETFGEDTHLVTQMGIAAVRGFQG